MPSSAIHSERLVIGLVRVMELVGRLEGKIPATLLNGIPLAVVFFILVQVDWLFADEVER